MNNLETMRKRLKYQGGNQEERMIKDKYRTFQKALLYSYQAAKVRKEDEDTIRKCLINPDKNKQDYDDKILSIDYAFGYKPGDIFEWVGTNTKWLIFLRELTEDAYFRAEIRRCKYQIKWIDQDSNTEVSTWCYVRGPVETKFNSVQKSGISLDVPNWSLELYIPATQDNIEKFANRYSRFIFDDKAWEVQVTDSISMEGILQVIALENYVNKNLDSLEKDIDGYFKVVPIVPETGTEEGIIGKTFIKPGFAAEYSGIESGGEWSILESGRPVTLNRNDSGVSVLWNSMTSGQFTLQYIVNGETYQKIIVVESLF